MPPVKYTSARPPASFAPYARRVCYIISLSLLYIMKSVRALTRSLHSGVARRVLYAPCSELIFISALSAF